MSIGSVSTPSRASVALSAALLLVACAIGTAFVRPPEDSIRLGETTRAQIVERFGKPDEEQHLRKNGQTLANLSYTFSSGAEATRLANSLCVRSIEFSLSGDVVVEESFVSSCAADHTDFDEGKVADIVKGKTRCDEVIAMLGRPAARAIYPIASDKGEVFLGYRFMAPKRPLLQFNIYRKALAVVCGPDGIVRETEFVEVGER
jgi:hypothetical protein